ncbi:hypothetical protein [Nocardia sp. BMG51109]|uniref:hypothetical protein n=1 Tax=Nocardia sp. BMG51109 TaxID=1056816 RepID=UPI000465FE3D|nr:hypothetical protein [Nocardia sp. BMG51109]
MVAFDHENPARGGWTIPGNLHPLCKRHHDLKSHRYWNCTALPGGAQHWRHHTGIERITVSDTGLPVIAEPPMPEQPTTGIQPPSDAPTAEESVNLLYEETWWERHMSTTDRPGNDPYLLAHYRRHQAITRCRIARQPAPF